MPKKKLKWVDAWACTNMDRRCTGYMYFNGRPFLGHTIWLIGDTDRTGDTYHFDTNYYVHKEDFDKEYDYSFEWPKPGKIMAIQIQVQK